MYNWIKFDIYTHLGNHPHSQNSEHIIHHFWKFPYAHAHLSYLQGTWFSFCPYRLGCFFFFLMKRMIQFATSQCREYKFDPWSCKIPHTVDQLSLCCTTTEARALQSLCYTREVTKMRSPTASHKRAAPAPTTRESLRSNEDPAQPKIKIHPRYCVDW